MRIADQTNFAAGALYISFGVAVAVGSLSYEVGSASRMGPGYFPLGAGIALAMTGLIVLIGALRRRTSASRLSLWPLKNVGLILASVAMFAVSLETLGLIVALPLLVGVSAWAHPNFSWQTTAISILFQLVLVWVVFVMLLGIRVPLFPPFAV
jgi:Tripartite tricarboxylate transporter TctB family